MQNFNPVLITMTGNKLYYKWLCVNCDVDLGDKTLGQGHEKPFGTEQ